MANKDIKKNINKRNKEINFYCIFTDDEKTFQDKYNIVFKDYLENLRK